MSLLKSVLSVVLLTLSTALPGLLYAQSGPPAPSSGIWAIIDTTYDVGTTTKGFSMAKITIKNTTSTNITGTQFRVFYDKSAFSSCSVSLVNPNPNLNLQFVDNNLEGHVTMTLVYTGNSAVFSLPNSETFQLKLQHVSSDQFMSLSSIKNLSWSAYSPPLNTFPSISSNDLGIDVSLGLHNWGGQFMPQTFKFTGNFRNVTGSGARNIKISLEKKPKTSSVWSLHNTYTTDINGKFFLNEAIDTTYWNVRLSIKGDTMGIGNVISVADAQLINKWVLGSQKPQSWDFYTGDVNGSGDLTISDAYSVFARIATRLNTWPNGQNAIKFFDQSEYNTITLSPNTNFTSTIQGKTNFTYDILPNLPDSVNFWVAVVGDANGTGFRMARFTPILVTTDPEPNTPSRTENILDLRVEYDFPTNYMEINCPSLNVNSDNLIEVPVKIKTKKTSITSLQFALGYDPNVLEFKDFENSEKVMNWISFVNPTKGEIEWGGFDPTRSDEFSLSDEERVFMIRFYSKSPQTTWNQSPLYTTRKFSGDINSKDMEITPINGILVVYKMKNKAERKSILVYPNPLSGDFSIQFELLEDGPVEIYIVDNGGKMIKNIMKSEMKKGIWTINSNLERESNGYYMAILSTKNGLESTKLIKK